MMANAQAVESASGKGLVRFRMDDGLRMDAESVLDRMGLSMATVMTMLARRIVAEGKLPFEIYAVSTPLELTRDAVARSRAAIKSVEGRVTMGELLDELDGGAQGRQ